jgi:phosphatidylglycerophosphate synthase
MMLKPRSNDAASFAAQRPWDARLAAALVAPLKDSWVTPNHLTTVRLGVGVAAAGAFLVGSYAWSNIGALLLVLSNFLDHTDGELARLSGKSSRIGHIYDLASDALVTILLFLAIGIGLGDRMRLPLPVSTAAGGAIAGCAVALIFYLRMRIEALQGKEATRQASLAGFETEDVLYLLPFVTLCDGLGSFLVLATCCAPLFALWVVADYLRTRGKPRTTGARSKAEVSS